MSGVEIRDLVTVSGGGTPRKAKHEFFGGGIPWVTPKDMKRPLIGESKITLTEAGVQHSPAKVVPSGSVLVVVRSGVLKHTLPVALATRPVTLNQDMKALTPIAGVDGAYLARFVKARQSEVLGWVRATTADNFPIDKLLDLQVDLPTLVEQRRIAAILDQADALRAKRRQVLAHLDALTRSIFHQMFSRDTPRARLGDLARTSSGGTPDRSVSAFFGGGIPWVKSGELHAGSVTATEETLSPLGVANSSAKLLSPGCILIAMYGATAGVVAQLEVEAATNQAICAIEPGPRVQGPFLAAALRSMSELLLSLRTGGAQPNLSQAKLRDLEIPVPSPVLQTSFADRVQAIEIQRSLSGAALIEDERLFAALQSRAFRGDL